MWHHIMVDRFGAIDPRASQLRFHTQTDGSTLTAQQPELNTVRVALQALGAVLGGTQSLHTNAYDEALGLPTERSARIALRTQQVLAHETGIADSPDPLGGSWFVEALTDDTEAEAWRELAVIDEMGGAVAAIEAGHEQAAIEAAAYAHARAVEAGERIVVGVNRFVEGDDAVAAANAADPGEAADRVESLAEWRRRRDPAAVEAALGEVEVAARGDANLMGPIGQALRRSATVGEISDALRRVFGTWEPGG
jgi:methylmalonyl-CoA mutase N-terminal domain/subunit